MVTVPIQTVQDSSDEGVENFRATLSNTSTGVTLGSATTHDVFITDRKLMIEQ